MYLHFVSMSRLHPSSLNNFLRSSCFNIELSLSPMCPSISCIHFASYVDFPHWPLHHFLRFYCFNTGTSPASTTSCTHLVSVSKFPPPCARSKKCTGSKLHDRRPQTVGGFKKCFGEQGQRHEIAATGVMSISAKSATDHFVYVYFVRLRLLCCNARCRKTTKEASDAGASIWFQRSKQAA